jgi:hypothetical protein
MPYSALETSIMCIGDLRLRPDSIQSSIPIGDNLARLSRDPHKLFWPASEGSSGGLLLAKVVEQVNGAISASGHWVHHGAKLPELLRVQEFEQDVVDLDLGGREPP